MQHVAGRVVRALHLSFGLFKLRIGIVIGITAAAGAAVAPGPAPALWQLALLVLAVVGAAATAGGFNQYVERDLDRLMRRTNRRPFVTGEIAADPRFLWLLGAVLVGSIALAALAANLLAAAYVFLGAFFYGVVYTVWLKRRTWWNIVIGGLAGSFAVLAGAAAVTPSAPPAVPAILAAVLFLWTPPHFWSLAMLCRDDYARARVPMLPVVIGDARCSRVILAHTVALVGLSIAPLAYGMGFIYAAGAIAGGVLFLTASVRLARRPVRETARANFHASLAQLALVLSSAILDRAILG
ncbi:MAG: protoheme IX farnesyltransferase [Betaproteobacteria bacterium]|nr:protoheme IX farnesyltransferase [Betaproteobacteria bacterium]